MESRSVPFEAVTNDPWSQKLLQAADWASEKPDGGTDVDELNAYVKNNTGQGYVIVDGKRVYASANDLADLRRTKVGPLVGSDARTVTELRESIADERDLGPTWVDFDRVPLPFGAAEADAQQEDRILHGQSVLFRQLEGDEGDWVKLINRRRRLIAVGTVTERIGHGPVGVVQPRIVFN